MIEVVLKTGRLSEAKSRSRIASGKAVRQAERSGVPTAKLVGKGRM